MAQLSEEQINEYRTEFNAAGGNRGNGTINAAEMGKAFRACGMDLDDDTCQGMLNDTCIDFDGSGTLNFKECCVLVMMLKLTHGTQHTCILL